MTKTEKLAFKSTHEHYLFIMEIVQICTSEINVDKYNFTVSSIMLTTWL